MTLAREIGSRFHKSTGNVCFGEMIFKVNTLFYFIKKKIQRLFLKNNIVHGGNK